MSMNLVIINEALIAAGLTPRGAFHPEPEDGAPDLGCDRPAQTIVLAGNAGPAMWQTFSAACDPATTLLDDWSRDVFDALARSFTARAVYPFEKPYLPFQRWAQKAEPCHASPLGMYIHPDYGLWHGYRGGLAFAERLSLPVPDRRPSPCVECEDQPCLSACSVQAFSIAGYDVPACVGHLTGADGTDCTAQGCLSRRACPLGTAFRYPPEQTQFHMNAFLKNHGKVA